MQFIIRNEDIRAYALEEIRHLPLDPPHKVSIEKYSPRRSLDQNAFLHAVPLRLLADATGHEIKDLKEYLLGEAFGWQDSEIFGSKVQRPMKRSSELNTKEFSWFLDWIESWASQTLGIILPRPNEVLE